MPVALGVRQPARAMRAIRDFQNAPDIPRPNIWAQQIPVVGSAWQAAGDLQDGDYGAAALNGGMAVLEALPVGTAVKGARAATLGVSYLAKKGYRAVREDMVKAGLVKKGQEVHHIVRLNGASRTRPDIRNNPALLKPLSQEQHRRIHGRWAGKPRYDPLRRAWYGSTEAMKTAPAGLIGYTISSAENANRASPGHAKAPAASQPAARRN